MPAKRKSTRRPRGTGSIFFHETRGVWVGRKVIGKKPNGKTLYAERSGRTQAELLKKLEKAGPPGPTTTLKEYAEKWLASLTTRPRSQSIRREAFSRRVLPSLGHLPIAAITHTQIEAAVKTWDVGTTTARMALASLGACFSAARREGLRGDNPLSLTRKPKATRRKIDPFTMVELEAIMREASWRPSTRVIACIAGTGCRLGEAVALDAHEFDPAGGAISINRTAGMNSTSEPGPPKSEFSVRTIRVHKTALPAVCAAKGKRTAGALFLNSLGRRCTVKAVGKAWVALLKRAGIRYRCLHQTRHSIATHMLAAGKDLADIARHLGDTVGTVVSTYLHATGADPMDALDGGVKVVGGRSDENKS